MYNNKNCTIYHAMNTKSDSHRSSRTSTCFAILIALVFKAFGCKEQLKPQSIHNAATPAWICRETDAVVLVTKGSWFKCQWYYFNTVENVLLIKAYKNNEDSACLGDCSFWVCFQNNTAGSSNTVNFIFLTCQDSTFQSWEMLH